ncbi:MAG TPA: MBL fold metallo-hydrolase [Methanomassiliicoccales archaeon]|nr:MBL fold metallo-hydrolase [Methanomassiliicoccales archaeon]
MKIKFLGGADVVGRMGMLLNNKGANLLFEYGMSATRPPTFPEPAPQVDHALLTHCHLDHCGMMPWLCSRFDTRVAATPSTIAVSQVIMQDSIKVADSEGYPRQYQPEDIRTTMSSFQPYQYGDVFDVGGFEVELHSAGHVPGATMYELRGDSTTLFTGDMHTYNMRLVYGAHPVKCDNLIIEGTYGGRLHPDRLKTEYQFIEKVKEVVDRGGKAIVPCFAVGRTQEIMLLLKDLKLDMWVDGMGKTINRLYLDYPEYLRSEKAFKQARNRFNEVRTPSGRDRAKKGDVIVSTGGMLDGGPVLEYIKEYKDDPKSAILLTGFQAEGSNGRMLLEKGKILYKRPQAAELLVPDQAQEMRVRCEVKQFDLSAHADHNELLAFIRGCDPDKVVLMHSDVAARQALAKDLEDEYTVLLPKTNESIEL